MKVDSREPSQPAMEAAVTIIGGGISGLATAAWLEHDHGINDVVVLEADARPGGKVYSQLDRGHCLEWGPQGFLDNAPDTLELARIAGIEEHLVRADEASADRFILRKGVLRSVPTSPLAFLRSDILPLGARLRVLGEPLAGRRPEGDESVFDFARRRIGATAAEVLVDAMVTGVFAGDSRRLSLAATFPRMAEMEARYGSLTRAMLAKMREARRDGRRSGGPSGPGGTLCTFDGGMARLPLQLASRLDDRLHLQSPVLQLERADGVFHVRTEQRTLRSRAVLLALPAAAAAALLETIAPAAVEPLRAITTAPIVVVMTSYRRTDVFGKPMAGFGFLVPRGETVAILGSLFCHAIFPGQAPDGRLFLRTMLGGARDPAAIELDDTAILGRVRQALQVVTGHDPEPDQVWIIRHPQGISQYTIGHLDRVAAAEQAARQAGVELTGSPYRGVSVNDCIRQARRAATAIKQRLDGSNHLPE